MHFRSWKTPVFVVLTLLTLCSLFFLNGSHSVYAASTHSTSSHSQAATNGQNVVANALYLNDDVQWCRDGYVCIYAQNDGWPGTTESPTDVYYAYGVYQLYDQYGLHWVYNNQTDNAGVWLCTGSYGTNCIWYIGAMGIIPISPRSTPSYSHHRYRVRKAQMGL